MLNHTTESQFLPQHQPTKRLSITQPCSMGASTFPLSIVVLRLRISTMRGIRCHGRVSTCALLWVWVAHVEPTDPQHCHDPCCFGSGIHSCLGEGYREDGVWKYIAIAYGAIPRAGWRRVFGYSGGLSSVALFGVWCTPKFQVWLAELITSCLWRNNGPRISFARLRTENTMRRPTRASKNRQSSSGHI
jgi:hypothetical protein